MRWAAGTRWPGGVSHMNVRARQRSKKHTRYSDELMARVLHWVRLGYPYEYAAAQCGVSTSSVQKWIIAGRGGATPADRHGKGRAYLAKERGDRAPRP